MRIGINTLAVVYGKQDGQGNYTCNIIEHLSCIDSHNEYILFVAPWNQKFFQNIRQDNFRQVVCSVLNSSPYHRALWEQMLLPRLVHKYELDVFHSPIHTAPRITSVPYILTVQAPISLAFGNHGLSFPVRVYWNTVGLARIRRATRLIAVSNACKEEIQEYAKVGPDNITVIYHGIGEHFLAAQRSDACGIAPVDFPYVLWVGMPHGHKNLPRMLQAFARLKKEYPIPHKLLLVGPKLVNNSEVIGLREEYGLRDSVVLRQAVPNEMLPRYYAHANAFFFPSLTETFGIPIIEAMACGTPVVTSNIPATSEVAGGDAVIVDPNDVESIAEGLHLLLTDQVLRQDLISRGLARARQFSWEKAARETLAVYDKLGYVGGDVGGQGSCKTAKSVH